jgi:hypothetical protein
MLMQASRYQLSSLNATRIHARKTKAWSVALRCCQTLYGMPSRPWHGADLE